MRRLIFLFSLCFMSMGVIDACKKRTHEETFIWMKEDLEAQIQNTGDPKYVMNTFKNILRPNCDEDFCDIESEIDGGFASYSNFLVEVYMNDITGQKMGYKVISVMVPLSKESHRILYQTISTTRTPRDFSDGDPNPGDGYLKY